MYLPQEIIRKKRDGKSLAKEEIAFFVQGITNGDVSEGQIAALAMAIFFRGMSRNETVDLTHSMTNSGHVINWDELKDFGPIVDKHSTGGVGDKLSLMLAPIIAACGGFIPMISGRGLGHTGGTLDKLDAIPGYQTSVEIEQLKAVTKKAGCAIVGQTGDLAPADKRFYSIRDVTSTVEAIPLITASILSKKLSAGLQGLVMDIKVGSGAFAATPQMAEELANTLVSVANHAGLPTTALITDMDQVLGTTAGNALEVYEAWSYLAGKTREKRQEAIITALCTELLLNGNLASDADDAEDKIYSVLNRGKALECFQKMIAGLGGPVNFCEAPEKYLKTAKYESDIFLDGEGYIATMDTREIGMAVVSLGGGRTKPGSEIDHTVGFSHIEAIGTEIDPKMPVARVHANSEADAAKAAILYRQSLILSENPPIITNPVLIKIVNSHG